MPTYPYSNADIKSDYMREPSLKQGRITDYGLSTLKSFVERLSAGNVGFC